MSGPTQGDRPIHVLPFVAAALAAAAPHILLALMVANLGTDDPSDYMDDVSRDLTRTVMGLASVGLTVLVLVFSGVRAAMRRAGTRTVGVTAGTAAGLLLLVVTCGITADP